jgi:PAS domain S-box-containing protein
MSRSDDCLILIVEDNTGTATLQRRAVERAGYRVLTAGSAEEAIEVLKADEVSLILLDNRLPGELSGLDFLTNLRSVSPDLPVIMVSGSDTGAAVIQALRGGVRDFVRKDVNYLEYLPQTISTVLQRARLEAQLRDGVGNRPQPILVVEDDPGVAMLQSKQLERAGFEVLVAHTAADALRQIEKNDVGLLVLDHNLPDGVTGLELYQRIRGAGHDLPAIMVSSHTDEGTVLAALRAGVRDYVAKAPDYLTELRQAVQRVGERVRLEAQIADSKARLAGIVSSAMDAIILIDHELRITVFNPAAEEIFETSAGEALGQPITRFIPDLASHIQPPASGGQGNSPTVRQEVSGLRAKGKPAELEITVANLHVAGRPFFSVIARDVTQRKELERLLLQKDKLESLGLLAGGIAHDFNNILVGIMGNASLALDTLGPNNPASAMLRDVMVASETAGNLTRQLLAYAGKGRFVIEPVNLSDLVRQLGPLLQTSIPKTAQLRFELADSLPSVEADITQIQQLIMNLVINGAEAMGDKPGDILITTGVQDVDEAYIATALASAPIKPGRYVDLQIHDTGSGMSQETIDRIFDPFFTTKFTGRGLGLAAVLGIVRGHKGAIKVYSAPGRGTTFKILFPVTDQRVVRRADSQGPERTTGAETVLVIDDENIVRRSAKTVLERYGYEVVLAENGKEGLELYRVFAGRVKVVLLDMTMPVMGGEETFRALKTINPDVRVILSSGYNEAEAVRRFTGKGLAGFLQKPYSAATLTEKIRSVLRDAQT